MFGNPHDGYIYMPLFTATIFFVAQHLTKHATFYGQTTYTATTTATTGKKFSIFICTPVQGSGQGCVEQRNI
jgi:hypothetical protein